MRIDIEIDDYLLRRALRCARTRNKTAVIEASLRLLISVRSQAAIRRLRGKVRWEGNLSQSRLGRILGKASQ